MAQAQYRCRMPQYLGCGIQMLWWEADEVGIILFFLGLGVFVGGWTWLGLLVVPNVYGRFKKNYPRGFLMHLLYFAGMMRLNGYPSAFEKHFTE